MKFQIIPKLLTAARLLTAAVLLTVLSAIPAEANVLFPDVLVSEPTDGQAAVLRQIGRKGLLFKFNYTDDVFNPIAGGFPLNLAGATVQLTLGANPPLGCTAGANPAAGQCSFLNVDGNTPDGQLDYVEILYNGDFPANTSVTYSVAGAVSAMGETQDGGTDNTVQFTTGAAMLRDLASIELVFDQSGSMGWPAVPGGSVSRMDALKGAAQVFFEMLGDYVFVGDKLGSVFFSSSASVFDPTAGGTNLEPAHDPTQVGLIAADLQARVPGGATSIGDGLAQANLQGFAADPTPNPTKYALLLSDGEQNTAPLVSVVGNAVQVGGAAYDPTITVCTITAGRMTAPGFVLQDDISQASCEHPTAHIQPGNDDFVTSDLETFFAQALGDVLVGDKVEMVRNVEGEIFRGQTVDEPFLANPRDIALSIALSWSGDAPRDFLHFDLEAPDGTIIDPGSKTRFGRNMSFTTLHLPVRQGGGAVPIAGEWKVRIRAVDTQSTRFAYHLMVMLDNAGLASEFSLEADDPGTGDPIPVRVRLTEGGAPVLGATVAAKIAGPDEGLGDILSDADNPNFTPGFGDGGDNAEALEKLLRLLEDPASAGLFGDHALPDLVLVDDGSASSDDEAAGDGIYSGLITGTDEEGHYQLAVEVRGDGPVNGAYQRTRRMSVFVRPKPEPDNTVFAIASVTPLPNAELPSQRVVIQITPRDRFGNRIGPGYLGHLQMRSAHSASPLVVVDNLDGVYQTELTLPQGADPEITLEVLGDEVDSRPLSDFAGGSGLLGSGGPAWSLHWGVSEPNGSLGSIADGAGSYGLDLEIPLRSPLSLELYLGHDRFEPKLGGDEVGVTHLSARGRWTFGGGVWRPALFVGVGGYLDEDDDLFFGASAGAALDRWITPRWAIEASATYHNVDGGLAEYTTAQLGARIRF